MATKIRPIVFKIDEPDGFVMNASNATYGNSGTSYYVSWESPTYPNAYDGGGKHYVVVNNNTAEDITARLPTQLMYAKSTMSGGPDAIGYSIMQTIGTSTGTLTSNAALGGGYGVYLQINLIGTEEQVRAYIANLTITILDP